MAARPDPTAIDDLLAHAGWLNRLARQLVRDGDLAADATQEVWLAAHRSPPDPARPTRPWLGEVLRNVIRMRVRRETSRAHWEPEAIAPAPPTTPEAVHERLELHRLVVECVLGLDESLRATILLHFFEEKSSAEIARLLQIPAGTVRWRLKTALERLRVALDRRCDGDRSRWAIALAPAGAGVRAGRGSWQGGLIMAKAKGTLIAAAAIVLVLVGGVAWWRLGRGDRAVDAASGAVAVGRAPALRSGWVLPANPSVGQGRVAGRVLAPAGQVVANAAVTLVTSVDADFNGRAPPFTETHADAQGAFAFAAVGAGRYTLVAAAKGWGAGRRSGIAIGAGDDVAVDVTLAARGVELQGQISDAGGGPIPGALVTAVMNRTSDTRFNDPYVLRAIADAQGRYQLFARPGQHSVRVEAAGYGAVDVWLNLDDSRRRDFELAPAVHISGRVLERATRAPVADAEVALALAYREGSDLPIAPVRSDAEGRFVFAAIAPGMYSIAGRKESLVSGSQDMPVMASAKAEIELLLDPGRSISGHVRDVRGAPVGGAVVALSKARFFVTGEPSVKARSAADGSYRVTGLLPGQYNARAKLDAFPSMNYVAITVTDADRTGVDVILDRPAELRGTVVGADGQPAADVDVEADTSIREPDRTMNTRQTVASDVQGSFHFLLPPAQVKTRAEGGAAGRAFVDLGALAAGETRSVVLRLAPAGSARISGIVLDDDGQGLAGIAVSAINASHATQVRSDGAGRFSVADLDPGKHRVMAARDEVRDQGPWNTASVDVTLRPAEERTGVVLKIPDLGAITGQVVDDQQRPVAGAILRAAVEQEGRIKSNAAKRTSSDQDGRFAFNGLPLAPHSLTVLHDEHPNTTLSGVTVGRADVVVRLGPAARLSGVVVDSDGRPARDFLLEARRHGGGAAGVVANDPASNRTSRQVHDPLGHFDMTRLGPGTYVLSAITAAGQSGSIDVLLRAGEARTDLAVSLAVPVSLALRVIDGASGSAVAGAKSRISHDAGEATGLTDAAGQVTYTAMPAGAKADLFILAPGFAPLQKRIDVPTGGTTTPELVTLTRPAAPVTAP